jgi:hypothetical protein
MSDLISTPDEERVQAIRAKVEQCRNLRADAGEEGIALTGKPLAGLSIAADRPKLATLLVFQHDYVRWANETLLELAAELSSARAALSEAETRIEELETALEQWNTVGRFERSLDSGDPEINGLSWDEMAARGGYFPPRNYKSGDPAPERCVEHPRQSGGACATCNYYREWYIAHRPAHVGWTIGDTDPVSAPSGESQPNE